jgi:hypothetical protein
LGLVIGPVAVGVLIDAGGFTPPFLVAAVLVLSGAVALWVTAGRLPASGLTARQTRSGESA